MNIDAYGVMARRNPWLALRGAGNGQTVSA